VPKTAAGYTRAAVRTNGEREVCEIAAPVTTANAQWMLGIAAIGL
jgi:hypothetical protein